MNGRIDMNIHRTIQMLMPICLCLAISGSTYGKCRLVQRMEGEARMGATVALGGNYGGHSDGSLAMGLEGRFNIRETPWDCGIALQFAVAEHHFVKDANHSYDATQGNRTLSLAMTGDYNLRQGYKVNPFVGAAFGLGLHDIIHSTVHPTSTAQSVFFEPRIGVELLYHIRLTGSVAISRKGYNYAALTLGFVVGGRPKKTGDADI